MSAEAPDTTAPTGGSEARDSGPPPVVVVAGMHRSGTSLLARYLVRSGVHMGDRLVEPQPSNPYGHFEDRDFLELHRRVLMRENEGDDMWAGGPPTLTAEERLEARRLVERKRAGGRPWGWKDPRTCLFLELWAELVPEATFLCIFRHPSRVVDSLRRRHDVGPLDFWQNRAFIRGWIAYDREILELRGREPARTVLFDLHRAVEDPDRLAELLTRRLEGRFSADTFRACYDPSILERKSPRGLYLSDPLLHARARFLYRALRRAGEI